MARRLTAQPIRAKRYASDSRSAPTFHGVLCSCADAETLRDVDLGFALRWRKGNRALSRLRRRRPAPRVRLPKLMVRSGTKCCTSTFASGLPCAGAWAGAGEGIYPNEQTPSPSCSPGLVAQRPSAHREMRKGRRKRRFALRWRKGIGRTGESPAQTKVCPALAQGIGRP